MTITLRLCALFSFLFIISCSDPADINRPKDPDIIIPDLEETATGSVSGFVINEAGEPVPFAVVSAGDEQVLSDAYGYFRFTNIEVSAFAAEVSVVANGYFNAYATFTPEAAHEQFVRVSLIQKPTALTLDAATGGTVTIEDGATLQLQPNSVVNALTGAAYTGEIKIHSKMLSADASGFTPGYPGDGRGVSHEGHAKVLMSFSPIVIELSTPGGQPLQLATGKPATLTIPMKGELQGSAPATISLWSYDTGTGLWKEEGSAVKDGVSYVGTVEHFSFWDGAMGSPMITVSATIVNAANQPLVHVPVRIGFEGMPVNAGHDRWAYTDANGVVSGALFANREYVLDVLTPCATSAYSHNFSTAAADVDLGTLTGNLGQSSVVLSGQAENCAGQAITNGYVQTYDGGFYHRIPIVNGNFSFAGIMCTNTTVNLVAVDLATYLQNAPKEVNLTAGANNAGTLEVCGTSTMGHITYTYDGTTVSINEPADTIGAYAFTGGTQIVTLSGDPNASQKMAFQLYGSAAAGTNTVTEVFSTIFPSGRGYWPANISVTITEYGKVGGFIAGEFSSNMLDFEDNSMHTFSCSFRIRRYY